MTMSVACVVPYNWPKLSEGFCFILNHKIEDLTTLSQDPVTQTICRRHVIKELTQRHSLPPPSRTNSNSSRKSSYHPICSMQRKSATR